MDTRSVPEILEALATELERPRELSAQVIAYLCGTYGLERTALGVFLVSELPKLEDYEVDLILSSLFTPTLADQAVFAERLGRAAIPKLQWPALIQQLVTRPTYAQLVTRDGAKHSVPLRDVTIERLVHRLRLEGTVPEPLFKLIQELPPAADRPLLLAVARRSYWENEAHGQILMRYLTTALARDAYRLTDVVDLVKLVEIYEPADVGDLRARIPHWLQVLRQEINEAGGAKPFFNERVEELHGGGRDQRRQDDVRLSAKEKERAFLERLEQVLAG